MCDIDVLLKKALQVGKQSVDTLFSNCIEDRMEWELWKYSSELDKVCYTILNSIQSANLDQIISRIRGL